jgi:hypothetical protein
MNEVSFLSRELRLFLTDEILVNKKMQMPIVIAMSAKMIISTRENIFDLYSFLSINKRLRVNWKLELFFN